MCNTIHYFDIQITPEKIPAAIYFVECLDADIKETNHNITTDNWFTTISLTEKLFDEFLLTTIGTIKEK